MGKCQMCLIINKAFSTTNYILNKCVIRPILKNTSYELLKGKKNQMYPTSKPLATNASCLTMERIILANLILGVRKASLCDNAPIEKHIGFVIKQQIWLKNTFKLFLIKIIIVALPHPLSKNFSES